MFRREQTGERMRPRTRQETGERMRAFRKANGIRFYRMARALGVPGCLLEQLEDGVWITHPRIAARVCAAYGLDVEDYNNLVAKKHRVFRLPRAMPPPGVHWREWERLAEQKD